MGAKLCRQDYKVLVVWKILVVHEQFQEKNERKTTPHFTGPVFSVNTDSGYGKLYCSKEGIHCGHMVSCSMML